MGAGIVFNVRAHVVLSPCMGYTYEAVLDGFPDKYALIGFDTKSNPIEILYNPADNDTITVFHAMKVRGTFLAELGL